MGPTAAGKTDLAVSLVTRLPCEIISVDSAMVYRGMDIGTAKPGPAVLAVAPHRLLDVCDPADSYSAAQFRRNALTAMQEISAAGRIPLLVGGTGLYFRALQHGLSTLPAADPAIRARLLQEGNRLGWAAMHARLAEQDPLAATRIHPHDPQRIQRALEVYELTGQPMTQLQEAQRTATAFPYHVIKLVLAPVERSLLHQRIAVRFQAMLAAGFMDEVRQLFQCPDLQADSPAMRAVGYRQAWQYLAGEVDYDKMVEQGIAATRQLARRQLTWLRSEPDALWFDSGRADAGENALQAVLNFLKAGPIQH